MQLTNSAQLWLKSLSVFWLVSAIHLFGIPPINAPNEQTQTFLETESNVPSIDVEYLPDGSTASNTHPTLPNSWSSLFIVPATFEVVTNIRFGQWPERSRINSYQNITSYQYYISSLSSIS